MSDDNDVEESPWIEFKLKEPPKNQEFWAWDDQLERIVKAMKWFDADIQDWGSDTDHWSGSFSYWMLPTEEAIASPYTYQN